MKKDLFKIGFILIIIGICLLASYIIYYEIKDKEDTKNIELSINNYVETSSIEKEIYKGILFIPKLNLEKGFYDFNDKKNNVNKNITLIKGSTFPNKKNSVLVLAAHSGNSKISYFHNLDKLELKDEVNLMYQNKLYTFIVNKIYKTNKNGKININKEEGNYLILTTCDKKNNSKQLVIKCILK